MISCTAKNDTHTHTRPLFFLKLTQTVCEFCMWLQPKQSDSRKTPTPQTQNPELKCCLQQSIEQAASQKTNKCSKQTPKNWNTPVSRRVKKKLTWRRKSLKASERTPPRFKESRDKEHPGAHTLLGVQSAVAVCVCMVTAIRVQMMVGWTAVQSCRNLSFKASHFYSFISHNNTSIQHYLLSQPFCPSVCVKVSVCAYNVCVLVWHFTKGDSWSCRFCSECVQA